MKTPRFIRFATLIAAAAVLVWIAGCGDPGPSAADDPQASPSSVAPSSATQPSAAELIEQRRAEYKAEEKAEATAAVASAREALANEPPIPVTRDDFQKGAKLEGGGQVTSALKGVLRAGEDIQLKNLEHNLRIHGEAQGYPESHEEFMKLVQQWRIRLPPLKGPYDYRYNPEDHQLYKAPSLEKFDAMQEAKSGSASE